MVQLHWASRIVGEEKCLLASMLYESRLVLFSDYQSGAATRGDTGEAQENSLLCSQVLETGCMVLHAGSRGEAPASIRRQKGLEQGESLGHSHFWSFHGKGKAGQGKELRIG